MAGSKYMRIAKKLQTACKQMFGVKLLIDQRQWYHKEKDMAITVYTVYQVVFDNKKDKSSKIQLFQTYSQIQLVLFLRDYWYDLNNWEIPTDNEVWEKIKEDYGKRKEPSAQEPSTGNSDEKESGRGTDRYRATIRDELYTSWKRNRGSKNDSGHTET